MKHPLPTNCLPAARRFYNLKSDQIFGLMGLKLSENQREQLKTLEPGQRVNYLKVRDNANLAAELGAELIMRRIFDREASHE